MISAALWLGLFAGQVAHPEMALAINDRALAVQVKLGNARPLRVEGIDIRQGQSYIASHTSRKELFDTFEAIGSNIKYADIAKAGINKANGSIVQPNIRWGNGAINLKRGILGRSVSEVFESHANFFDFLVEDHALNAEIRAQFAFGRIESDPIGSLRLLQRKIGLAKRINESSQTYAAYDESNERHEEGPTSPFGHFPLGLQIIFGALMFAASVCSLFYAFFKTGTDFGMTVLYVCVGMALGVAGVAICFSAIMAYS